MYNLRVRILLLNLYYPPDTSATAKMAQSLAEALAAKHEVTVVCGRPSYDPTEKRSWRLWQTEQVGKVKVVRVGSTAYRRFEMSQRLLNYLSYVAMSAPRAMLVGCDVVLAMTDPPFEGIVAAFVAMLKGKPYVYNIRDLYPDMAVGGAIVEPGIMARTWETLHRWAMRRATRIVALGEDMRARIIGKGIDGEGVVVVRDGAEIPRDSASRALIDAEVVGAIRGNFKFVVLHAGNLGFYGAWNTLIRAAEELAGEGVGFVFVGEGAQRQGLQDAASTLGNVRFLPFFAADKIPSVLTAPDAHIVTIKRGLEGVVVPSKMYGILAAGKPIIAVAPEQTDAVCITKEIGCGVAGDPDRPEELVAAIRALAKDPGRVKAMGAAAQAAAGRYDRVTESQKFLRIIEEAGRA